MNPFTLIKTLGQITVSVLVFTSSVLGTQYTSPIITHLVDIIRPPTTTVAIVPNAPNWATGLQMTSPLISSTASSSNPSAASGLASSTTYYFGIAALDGTGTTTIISTSSFKTDASTTQPLPEDINLKWTGVNGATGYAIYFSTSTPLYNQYFLATTTGQYTFSTSTASIAGSYTRSETTAFSELIQPYGPDILNDNIFTATSSIAASTTGTQIGGTVDATAGATTTACESDTAGSIFFNQSNKHEWGCDGTTWNKIF